jgi:hypothetical protein
MPRKDRPLFETAEIRVSYFPGHSKPEIPISRHFELTITHYDERGYSLDSWHLSSTGGGGFEVHDTIVAVFRDRQ